MLDADRRGVGRLAAGEVWVGAKFVGAGRGVPLDDGVAEGPLENWGNGNLL